VTLRIVVLDYGSGNLPSAQRALARLGARAEVSADLAVAATADGLVVPGVGAFAACMAGLTKLAAGTIITKRVKSEQPVLGICVGMQILFEQGEEHGITTQGLGLLPGAVQRLSAPRLPHIGWNTITQPKQSKLFANIDSTARFYFVHSYAAKNFPEASSASQVTYCEYGEPFVAAVEQGALSATQFHPEKSGDVGAQLLKNWLATIS
jgi:imidazole glycerol-phosphate synthase subunit HisH